MWNWTSATVGGSVVGNLRIMATWNSPEPRLPITMHRFFERFPKLLLTSLKVSGNDFKNTSKHNDHIEASDQSGEFWRLYEDCHKGEKGNKGERGEKDEQGNKCNKASEFLQSN